MWLTSQLSKNPHIMDGRWFRNTYLGGSGFSIRLLAPGLLFLLPFQKSSMMFFFSTRGQEPQQNVVLWGQEMYWFILDLAEYLVSCPWQIFIDWIQERTNHWSILQYLILSLRPSMCSVNAYYLSFISKHKKAL